VLLSSFSTDGQEETTSKKRSIILLAVKLNEATNMQG